MSNISDSEFKAQLVAKFGEAGVYDTAQATDVFKFVGFMAPFVSVVRKSDGQAGTLEFSHMPRFYFDFVPNI